MLLGPGLLSVAQSPILFIGAFIAMWSLSPKLAVLMMIPYPLFIVLSRVVGGRLYPRSLAAQQSLASMSNFVQENIAGMAVVKAYAMEEDQSARFAEANEAAAQQAAEARARVRGDAGADGSAAGRRARHGHRRRAGRDLGGAHERGRPLRLHDLRADS